MYGYIYLTENTITGKKYIGQHKGSFDPEYKGSGINIQRAVKKYGKDAMVVTQLATAESADVLNALEVQAIASHNAVHDRNYYNIAVGGGAWGSPHTLETRRKISIATTGRQAWNIGVPNAAARQRMVSNNPMRRPEVAAKKSASSKGQVAWNKRTETLICEHCKTQKILTGHQIGPVGGKRRKRFCGKSCAVKARYRSR